MTVLELGAILLKHRRVLVTIISILTFLGILSALFRPVRYTSVAVFLPQEASGSVSRILGFAQQFGFNFPAATGEGQRSPAFYSDLIQSRAILMQVVREPFALPTFDGDSTVLLPDYYDVDEETEAQRLARTIQKLDDDIDVSVERETSMITMSVTNGNPTLARLIADRILLLLNRFDQEVRQSQASAERKFAGERLEQLQDELRAAEEQLEDFLVQNRAFTNSPQLSFQHDRLQRAVSMQQELVNATAQAFEQARIDEVRNTPVITVIEPPDAPAFPDRRRRVVLVALFFFMGSVAGLVVVLAREYVARLRTIGREDYYDFTRYIADTKQGLRRSFGFRKRTR